MLRSSRVLPAHKTVSKETRDDPSSMFERLIGNRTPRNKGYQVRGIVQARDRSFCNLCARAFTKTLRSLGSGRYVGAFGINGNPDCSNHGETAQSLTILAWSRMWEHSAIFLKSEWTHHTGLLQPSDNSKSRSRTIRSNCEVIRDGCSMLYIRTAKNLGWYPTGKQDPVFEEAMSFTVSFLFSTIFF